MSFFFGMPIISREERTRELERILRDIPTMDWDTLHEVQQVCLASGYEADANADTYGPGHEETPHWRTLAVAFNRAYDRIAVQKRKV